MKTYHSYWALEQQATAKLAVVETNLNKLEQGLPKDKVAKSRRYVKMNRVTSSKTTTTMTMTSIAIHACFSRCRLRKALVAQNELVEQMCENGTRC